MRLIDSPTNKPLHIAQVAPLYESVPPQLYGGTERVVSYLTEELIRQGHDVTLFASGDSVTKARLIAPCQRSLRLDPNCVDSLALHLLMMEQVFQKAQEFDIIHFHIDYLHFPLSRRQPRQQLTTLHGRLDIPELQPLYQEFPEMPVVSISNDQRKPLPWVNWLGAVYHGLPEDLHTFQQGKGGYLAFLGRICKEKRPDLAIEVAQRTGLNLKIAAKVSAQDEAYYQETIEPMLRDSRSLVEFVGEVGGKEKDEFLGNALALVFPIDWPEPFGLVMIEAMACGTPVIAFRRGSVPEIIDDGETGFVVDTLDEMVAAVEKVPTLSRRRCREVFEERFTVTRMTQEYVRLYRKLLTNKSRAIGDDPELDTADSLLLHRSCSVS